jgi:hypothetical protein
LWPQISHIEAASLAPFPSWLIRARSEECVLVGHPGPSRNDRARVASPSVQSYVRRDGKYAERRARRKQSCSGIKRPEEGPPSAPTPSLPVLSR